MSDRLRGELKRTFRPEFLNRVDSVVVFHALAKEEIRQIVDMRVAEAASRIADQGIRLELTAEAQDLLASEGYNPQYGARPLRRTVQQLVEDPLCEGLLAAKFQRGDVVSVERDGKQIVLRIKERTTVADDAMQTVADRA
jgi:ATP-dependent Clp protease ATP-binding subunit ClpC